MFIAKSLVIASTLSKEAEIRITNFLKEKILHECTLIYSNQSYGIILNLIKNVSDFYFMLKNLCFDNVSIIIHFMYKQCVCVCVFLVYIL